MTPGAFETITVPTFADAGNVTMTVDTDIASGGATAAALDAGRLFLLAGDHTQYQCLSTPTDIGGGVYEFRYNRTAAATVTKHAWAITQPASDEALGLIYSQNDAGNTAGRAAHDAEADGYVYLDTQAARVWERNGPSGTWTDAATTVVLWVSTTGSDSDDTVESLRTIQAAVDRVAASDDLSGWNVIIALKAGTYAETVQLREVDGDPASLTICGEATLTGTRTPSSYIVAGVTDCFRAVSLKTFWTIDGVQVQTTKGHGLLAKNARLRFNQMRFGACSGAQIASMGGGTVTLAGNGYSIGGNANAHLSANGSGAVIDLQAESTARPSISILSASAFAAAFAWARAGSQIFTGTGLVFTGKSSVTGKRWRAEQNSSIDSGQSGERYLPGNAAGVAVKNGEYV